VNLVEGVSANGREDGHERERERERRHHLQRVAQQERERGTAVLGQGHRKRARKQSGLE
jgi:hypothetical protein